MWGVLIVVWLLIDFAVAVFWGSFVRAGRDERR